MCRTYARLKPQDSTRVIKSSMRFSKNTLFSHNVSSASISSVLRRIRWPTPISASTGTHSLPAPARLGRHRQPPPEALYCLVHATRGPNARFAAYFAEPEGGLFVGMLLAFAKYPRRARTW